MNKDSVFSALTTLKTAEEFEQFFQEILTPREFEEMQKRYCICVELNKGKTVQEVCKTCEVASATVVRGNRILKYGTGLLKEITQPEKK